MFSIQKKNKFNYLISITLTYFHGILFSFDSLSQQFRNMSRLRATGVSERGETMLRMDPSDRHLGVPKLSLEPRDPAESRRVVAQSTDQPAAESRPGQLEQRRLAWIDRYDPNTSPEIRPAMIETYHLLILDSDDARSCTSSISSNQKVKVREFIEELLSSLLNGPLDDVSVGQLMENDSCKCAYINQ